MTLVQLIRMEQSITSLPITPMGNRDHTPNLVNYFLQNMFM